MRKIALHVSNVFSRRKVFSYFHTQQYLQQKHCQRKSTFRNSFPFSSFLPQWHLSEGVCQRCFVYDKTKIKSMLCHAMMSPTLCGRTNTPKKEVPRNGPVKPGTDLWNLGRTCETWNGPVKPGADLWNLERPCETWNGPVEPVEDVDGWDALCRVVDMWAQAAVPQQAVGHVGQVDPYYREGIPGRKKQKLPDIFLL
jgi:hypothetical protein